MVDHLRDQYRASERHACRVLLMVRGTYRYQSHQEPWTELRMRICYRTIAITSCEIVSKVVIVFELASNALCATIRLENSVEMLTFDCSKAPSSTVPRPPVPAIPVTA